MVVAGALNSDSPDSGIDLESGCHDDMRNARTKSFISSSSFRELSSLDSARAVRILLLPTYRLPPKFRECSPVSYIHSKWAAWPARPACTSPNRYDSLSYWVSNGPSAESRGSHSLPDKASSEWASKYCSLPRSWSLTSHCY